MASLANSRSEIRISSYQRVRSHHRSGNKWLVGMASSQRLFMDKKIWSEQATYVKVGLCERQQTHGDVHVGICGRIRNWSTRISENGHIGNVTEIENPSRNMGQSTNPCSAKSD